jgi:hypothetical protein
MAKIVQFHEKGGPDVLKLEEVNLLPVADKDDPFPGPRDRLEPSRVYVPQGSIPPGLYVAVPCRLRSVRRGRSDR